MNLSITEIEDVLRNERAPTRIKLPDGGGLPRVESCRYGRWKCWQRYPAAAVARPDDDVLSFIGSSFRSVWALELLLLLKGDRRAWTRDELVAALRGSELVVSHALDGLMAAGLVSVDDRGASYTPASVDLSECVEQVEHFYRTRPNAVRRAIIAASSSSAAAFADAFKLRKD